MGPRMQTPQEELAELRRVEVMNKALQAILGVLMLATAYFLSDTFSKLERVTEKVHELDKRVTVLEHENGKK